MKRVILLAAVFLIAGSVSAGTAIGRFIVGDKTKSLTHSYVIEKNSLLRVVLATAAIDEAALYDTDVLQEKVGKDGISALVIQLDEDREADATFFFDPKLPAGLEVWQVGTFKPRRSSERELSGRVTMKDDGYSFSYDATFDSKIVVQPQKIEALAADATPADHALWRLEQMEIDYDAQHFRSVVMDGNTDAVKLFLTAGMPVETADALRLAVDMDKTAVTKLLLEHGANANSKDNYGQSIVMTAASNHRTDALALLIAAKADINTANEYRITPLAVAAEQGHLDIVNMLVAAGANVNARDTSGGTALSVAILRGYKEIVAALLAAGTDVQRDKDDLLALAAEKPEILAMLEAAIAKKK
ncbi:MAG TPA: ankyrin repeat domain-containing protein [Thermoanaerobaculia bacterium]|nr:ankyrin repeat domain-containing protein [Thermoanaerobaculia bacterium]